MPSSQTVPFSTAPNKEIEKAHSDRLEAFCSAVFTMRLSATSEKTKKLLRLDAKKDELNSSKENIFLKKKKAMIDV